MTPSRWWTLIAVLVIPLAGAALGAAKPDSHTSKPHAGKRGLVHPKLIRKTYPIADLVDAVSCADITKAIIQAVKPASWHGNGGRGTIEYLADKKTLVVKQTAETHRQIRTVLKALTTICRNDNAATRSRQCIIDTAVQVKNTPAKTAASGQPKQYGHFVLDNVRLNAMGVSCTIKSVRLMYKGDGIITDAAKTAVASDGSEKKQELMDAVGSLLEQMGVVSKSCGSCGSYSGSSCSAPMGCTSACPGATPLPTCGNGLITTSPSGCSMPASVPTETMPSMGCASACPGATPLPTCGNGLITTSPSGCSMPASVPAGKKPAEAKKHKAEEEKPKAEKND
jgi:hypothetical protein